MNYHQANQMRDSMRGENRYGDFVRQGLDQEAGAPPPPPPPNADANLAFDPNMDRRVDEVESMKQQLLANAKNRR